MSIADRQFNAGHSTEEWEQSLGAQLRGLRIGRGLDQSQLAALASVSLGSVRNLELGRGSTLATLVKVLRALGREDWLTTLAARSTVSPLDVLRSSRNEPRRRVYRERRPS